MSLKHRIVNGLRARWRQWTQGEVLGQPVELEGLTGICRAAWPTDAELLAAWEDLSQRVGTAFNSPSWCKAVFEQFGKAERLRLVVISDEQSLRAVIPLEAREDGGWEMQGRWVSDRLEPLIDPEVEASVWAIIIRLTAQTSGKDKPLVLHNLPADFAQRAALVGTAADAGYAVSQEVVEQTPVIDLPRTWDEYLASLDPHERKETRRKLNKAETKGGALLRDCDPAQVESSVQKCLELMESCGGEKGDAVKRVLRPLLERAAPAMLRSGRLKLQFLTVNDEVAASLLILPHPRGPMLYNCGVDFSKKEWSPGIVAVAMAIRSAIAEGASVFDLLRGTERYKYQLGATDRPLVRITLTPKG